ncbi:MAG: MOSC N-terminal beta barrel domain-containing protein [Bacteroidota bacterium]
MLTVTELYVYPVKSLAGIGVKMAAVTARGFLHDRRLMLVDEGNTCLTQRSFPAMALLQPVLAADGIYIHHKNNALVPLFVPWHPPGNAYSLVTVWDDTCEAQLYDNATHEWFSRAIGVACRLVYMPDTTNRKVDSRYAPNNEIVSFADAYPMLLIGQASLDDLNTRLAEPLPMNRFRPSIVFTGGEPFLEDQLQEFSVGNINFRCVKPCARCTIPTINQDTIAMSKEPLKTLATYRLKDNKVLFGQNLLHVGDGSIRTGDILEIKKRQPPAI